MKLKPFVFAERVVLKLKNGEQRDILRQLIEPLVLAGNILEDPEKFLDDLVARERQVTTVMENGVAFPHARSTTVRRLCLTVGLAEEGINFNPDSSSVSRVFFCIGVPAFAPTAHIPILQSLANYARDEGRVQKLLESTTAAQVVKKLSTFKG